MESPHLENVHSTYLFRIKHFCSNYFCLLIEHETSLKNIAFINYTDFLDQIEGNQYGVTQCWEIVIELL